jgi:2-oxoglutarate dehydrogenase E2 component (dihydrolipoamide succinyltransferase)
VREIQLPRLNSNDTTYVVIEWLKDQGSDVRAGDPLVAVETSKTVEELAAEHDGVLHRVVAEGMTCPVGATIGIQFESPAALDAYLSAPAQRRPEAAPPDGTSRAVLTDAARELAEREGVPMDALVALGRSVVKVQDVKQVIAQRNTTVAAVPAPGALQTAVAAVVERSHREIPAAFTVVRVYVDRAHELQRTISEERKVVVGLVEMFVRALGMLDGEFPAFYARQCTGDGGRSDVGVTVDVGSGLFIPVVPAAGALSLDEIAFAVMEHRRKAVRRAFHQSDLRGSGDIALSVSHEPGVVLAETIVFPGHVCMVSLGGVFDELALVDRELTTRSYVNVGVTYDHRLVNGRDAVMFLKAVKALIENPTRMDSTPEGVVR